MFGRRRASDGDSGLPADTADRMAEFGRFEFAPTESDLEGDYVWEQLQAPFLPHTGDSDRFISELAEQVAPAGGWSAYGAHRTIASLLSPTVEHPDYDRIRQIALHFLREEGIGADSLNDYEHQFWRQTEGREYPESTR